MRYLKVTLLIGFPVALFVAGLYETGLLHRLETALAIAIGRSAPPQAHSDRPLQYALCAICALGIAWTTIDISRFTLKLAVFATAFVQVITASWVLGLYGIHFSPLGSVAAMLLSFTAAIFYARSEGGRRKRVVRDMFGERVSQGTFLALVDLESPLNFDGEKCEATVVVCEIFNHEELASVLHS